MASWNLVSKVCARTWRWLTGPSYFASHNPVKFRRKQDRRNYRQRELTPKQAAIFHAAMAMIGNGRSVDEAVAWAKAKSK